MNSKSAILCFCGRAAMLALMLSAAATLGAQNQPRPKAPVPAPSANTAPPPASETKNESATENAPLPGDWAPELLYGVWNSANPEAAEALYAAAFAAGPDIIPQLEAALKDDRTAEFAAQSLAFIGGDRAFEILSGLGRDPRDLGLKRFLYGALGEIDTPQATQALFDAIARADSERDRTITETAILALTVRPDAAIAARLRASITKVQDPVIRDDLENAADVIAARAKYLASAAGANPEFSLERAVRTYFVPALEEPTGAAPAKPAPPRAGSKPSTARPAATPEAQAKVRVDHVTLSLDGARALARVSFSVPGALAHYDMVLVKLGGNWRLASVWMGPEVETSGQQ